jgi:hypothetical protein
MKPILFTPFTTTPTIRNTIRLIAACALFYWASGPIHAQTTDAKRELAVRAVATQEGPEMNRMLAQLAGSAARRYRQLECTSGRSASSQTTKRSNCVRR